MGVYTLILNHMCIHLSDINSLQITIALHCVNVN